MSMFFTALASFVVSVIILVIVTILFENFEGLFFKVLFGGLWIWTIGQVLASTVALIGLMSTVALLIVFAIFFSLLKIAPHIKNIVLRAIVRVLIYFVLFTFFTLALVFIFTDLP